MGHVDGTEIIGLVCSDDIAVFGEIDSKEHDLIVNYMDTPELVKGFAFFTEVAIFDVDSGTLVSEEKLLESIEEPFDFFFGGAIHFSELFHEDGVEFLGGVLAKGEG